MKTSRLSLCLLLGVAACTASSPEEVEVADSALNSGCSTDFEQIAFVESPDAKTGAGLSGSGARTFIADADGDGHDDVIHVSPGSFAKALDFGAPMSFDINVHRGDGQGKLGAVEKSSFVGHHAEALYTGDFDGDGRTDVAYLRYGGNELWVALRDAGGGWKAASRIDVPLCNSLKRLYMRPRSVVVRDFDGDGRADLLANIRNDDFHQATVLLRGDAKGLADGTCLSVTNGDGKLFEAPIESVGELLVGDFDGDGKLDAFGHEAGLGWSYSDLFGGAKRTSSSHGLSVSERAVFAVGKVDDDDKADVLSSKLGLYHSLFGQVAAPENDGILERPEITDPRYKGVIEEVFGSGRTPQVVIGDINGDGKLDIVSLLDTKPTAAGHLAPTACSAPKELLRSRPTRIPVQEDRSLSLVGTKDLTGDKRDELVVFLPAATNAATGVKLPAAFGVYRLRKN